MTFLIGILGAGVGGGLMTILLAMIQRHWSKEDKQTERNEKTQGNTKDIHEINQKLDDMAKIQDALVQAQKVSMAYDIRYLGSCCIYAKEITLDNKQTLEQMYAAYRSLPGANGLCGTVMEEVEKLRVVPGAFVTKEV